MKAWKEWPSWLKGGLIVTGLDLLFWLYFIFKVATCTGDMCGLAGGAVIVYGLPSLILAFIIGAIIGAASSWAYKIEEKLITKWTIAGSIIGLLWPVWFSIYRTLTSKFGFFELLSSFFQSIIIMPLTTLIISVVSIVVASWIFWIIGTAIKKK